MAQQRRGPGERVEHCVHVEGRATDLLVHMGGRGLLPERLCELTRTLLLGLEQACVLDCNHRLVGEGGDELDLLAGE